MNKKPKIDKSLIFLKSTVIALGIIFLVLLTTLIVLKLNKEENIPDMKCNENSLIRIANNIKQFEIRGNYILALTKVKNNHQEIIKIHSKCLEKNNKIRFLISNDS